MNSERTADEFRTWYFARARETTERLRAMTPEERAEYTEQIKWKNADRGATPETAALLVEQGYWTEEEAAADVERRRGMDAYLEREAKRLRPGGGRPKSRVNRDALIYCLRECGNLPYYKIDAFLKHRGFKAPSSPGARYAARRAGLKGLKGQPCAHTELAKLAAAKRAAK